MSDLTSLSLLILASLLLVSFIIRPRNRESFPSKQYSKKAVRNLEIAANICVAAARDGFGIRLDHTIESLALLDELIQQGWGIRPTVSTISADTHFVLTAYWAGVFVRHHKARWRELRNDNHPYLEFPDAHLTVDPSEIVSAKFQSPGSINLNMIAAQILQIRDERSRFDWHNREIESVRFEIQASVSDHSEGSTEREDAPNN